MNRLARSWRRWKQKGGLGLGQETTSSEFEGAVRVGDVFRVGDNIVLDILDRIDIDELVKNIKTTVVANQRVSFVIGGVYGKVEQQGGKVPLLGDLPVAGQMFRTRVGEAYRKHRSLLILVTPHLIKLR